MTLFPELKEDFTAENGVTYTWEDNRWRTKSFLTADGSVVEVGPIPPNDPSEGGLWYDSTRLELFVYYVDGDDNGGWVPCSPLGARVEAGEILQEQINTRLATVETDFVSKTKNSTITDGVLRLEKVEKADTALVLDFKREEDGNANKSCRFIDFKEDNHRMMDVRALLLDTRKYNLKTTSSSSRSLARLMATLGNSSRFTPTARSAYLTCVIRPLIMTLLL